MVLLRHKLSILQLQQPLFTPASPAFLFFVHPTQVRRGRAHITTRLGSRPSKTYTQSEAWGPESSSSGHWLKMGTCATHPRLLDPKLPFDKVLR